MKEFDIPKTHIQIVNRMLNRAALTLYGKRFRKLSEGQQDCCLLMVNLRFWVQGIGASIIRTKT